MIVEPTRSCPVNMISGNPAFLDIVALIASAPTVFAGATRARLRRRAAEHAVRLHPRSSRPGRWP
jgi:hypothetical protein